MRRSPGDEVMVVMERGNIVRSRVDEVSRTGRNTMGVAFAAPNKNDSIVAVARNPERVVEEAVEAAEAGESAAGIGGEPTAAGPDAGAPVAPAMDGPQDDGVTSPEDGSAETSAVGDPDGEENEQGDNA